MPNHCYQKLIINGEAESIARCILESSLLNKDQTLKFNESAFLPTPLELLEISSPISIVSQEEYEKAVKNREAKMLDSTIPDSIKSFYTLPLTQAMSDEYMKKFGADNWYDWAIINWGTKWGVYKVAEWDHVSLSEVTVSFQSAWTPATKIIQKLSALFPDLSFELFYVDEFPNFIGKAKIQNGYVDDNEYDIDSSEAKEVMDIVGYERYEEEEELQEENAD